MSVRIRIELRDEDEIFSLVEPDKAELARLLCKAFESMGADDLVGPYQDGGAQVFVLNVADPREHWAKISRRVVSEDRGSLD